MNSNRNWVLRIDPAVYKFLGKIPRHDSERILSVINNLVLDSYTGDIKKMDGEINSWRKRTGAYRIFYEIIQHQKLIHVYDLERRGSKTYSKKR